MTLRAILFDLGGTLLHYADPTSTDPERPFRDITLAGFDALLAALAESGVDIPPGEVMHERLDTHIRREYLAAREGLRGGSIETPMRAALADSGVSLDGAAWADARQHFYRRIDGIVSPRLGLQETLGALRARGYRLGLISNTYWAADLHDRHLAEHGLLEFFPVRVYSCDAPYQKPHPGIFKLALDALGVEAGQAAYVGDRPDVDVAGAQGAGMLGILIRSPYRLEGGGPQAGEVVPDAVIDELPDLPAALDALEAARP